MPVAPPQQRGLQPRGAPGGLFTGAPPAEREDCLTVVPDWALGSGVLNPLENLMKPGALSLRTCAGTCTPTSSAEFQRLHGPLTQSTCLTFMLCFPSVHCAFRTLKPDKNEKNLRL